jgi:hypothetical protein
VIVLRRSPSRVGMAKRKKKILFDVFGDSPAASEFSGREPGARERLGVSTTEGEVHVTKSLAGMLGALVVAVIGVSYYLGSIRGAPGDGSEAAPRIARDVPSAAGLEGGARTIPAYSILARSVDYTKFNRSNVLKMLQECDALLEDQGLGPAKVFEHGSDSLGKAGKFEMWVGEAATQAELDPVVKKLRGLTLKGKPVFNLAYALELKQRQ